MKQFDRQRRVGLMLGIAGFLNAFVPVIAEAAEPWPAKPIKLVASYAPGGTVDALARLIAPHLQRRLGQAVVVENRLGAGGTIAADFVAKSPKDGYTILVAAVGNISSAVSLFKKLPYDPLRDLQPVTMATRFPNILVVHPSLGVRTLKELLDKVKAEPGKFGYGSGGVGTSQHLAGELFKLMAQVDIVHVPYKGSGPAVSDLVMGQLMLAFADPAVIEHVKSGSVIALGQTPNKRQEQIKDIPTIDEAGVPGYDAINWQGFFVASATPGPILARLNEELTAILKLDEVKARIEGLGMTPTTSSPEQFRDFISQDIKLWAGVIERAGITTGQE